MTRNDFVDIKMRPLNMDIFLVRRNILIRLNAVLPKLSGKLLDAGCGKMPYKDHILKNSAVREYVGLDIASALIYDSDIKPDVCWDGVKMPFDDNSFDCCIATEVLEHCPDPEVFLKEVLRVLKPGAVLFFTVPFLWNLHEVPHDQYRYTPFSLGRHLTNAGFMKILIEPTGGWHSSMAQMMGLWIKRSPLSNVSRIFLSIILFPFYWILIKRENNRECHDLTGLMVPGLSGTAVK